MKRLFLYGSLVVLSSSLLALNLGKPVESGYKDYKKLAADYAKFAFNNDTASMMRFTDKDMWAKVIECTKQKSGKEGAMDDLFSSNYRRFFEAVYAVPVAVLERNFKNSGITYCQVDSVVADKDMPDSRPCSDMPFTTLHIFVNYNKVAFETRVCITQFKDKWYILNIMPDLYPHKAW
jgi:hypothetical protein